MKGAISLTRMTADERKHALDRIETISDQLHEVARRFEHLRWMAREDSSDCFLRLALAAGEMTLGSLSQTGTLLEILYSANKKCASE